MLNVLISSACSQNPPLRSLYRLEAAFFRRLFVSIHLLVWHLVTINVPIVKCLSVCVFYTGMSECDYEGITLNVKMHVYWSVCMNVYMFVLVMLKKCVSEDNFFQNRLQFRLKKFQIFKVKFESTWVICNYPHLINPIAFCSQQIAFWHLLESWPASVYDWCPFLWFITSLSHFLTVRRDT